MTTVPSTSNFEESSITNLHVPPHSIIAEQAVIGGLLINNDAWEHISGIVNEKDFYTKENRVLFKEISILIKDNQPFDIVTLSNSLQKDNKINSSGMLVYLANLAKETPSAANIVAYAKIVREKSIRRRLISTATEIIESSYRQEVDEKFLLDHAEQSIFDIATSSTKVDKSQVESIKDLSVDTYQHIEHLRQHGAAGTKTGFHDIDKNTLGLESGELIVIAGRPSMGKTTLAMNIIENIVFGENQKPAVIFSMEMSARQIVMRFFSSLGRINQARLRSGKLHDDEWPRLSSTMKMLRDAPIYIDDTSSIEPFDIHAKVRRLKRQHESLGVVMVDYLQLMQISGKSDNRTAEISQISRSMKILAREMEVPVLALSQLNRATESRQDKRPVMSDLRESGAIEQDADLIMMIYRDEVYNKETPDKNTAEVNITKQRNGPLFTSKLTFLGRFMRFENRISESAIPDGVTSGSTQNNPYSDDIGI